MDNHTKINATWNVITECSGEVRFDERELSEPLTWTWPRNVFVCTHGDLFHHSVPDEWIDRVFYVMWFTSQHRFQVMTKQAARRRTYITSRPHISGHPEIVVLRQPFPDICESFDQVRWPLPNVEIVDILQ
jgi:protein gp37